MRETTIYRIRLPKHGYYGKSLFQPVPEDEAIIFKKMKDARQQLNRINEQLMKNENATIESSTRTELCFNHIINTDIPDEPDLDEDNADDNIADEILNNTLEDADRIRHGLPPIHQS